MQIESANKQHPIPQNVMDVEFKLIGELTVRQFSYLVVFGILTMLTFKLGIPAIFKYPLLLVEIIGGLGFAFFPMNDVTLDKWVVNYINAIKNPRLRVWQHRINIPSFFTLDTKKQKIEKYEGPVYQKKASIDDLLSGRGSNQPQKDVFEDESDLEKRESEFFTKIGMPSKASSINTNNNMAADLAVDESETKQQFTSHAVAPKSTQSPINPGTPKIQLKEEPKNNTEEKKIEIKVDYSDNLKEMNQLKDKLIKEIEKNKYKVIEGKENVIEESKQQDPKSQIKEEIAPKSAEGEKDKTEVEQVSSADTMVPASSVVPKPTQSGQLDTEEKPNVVENKIAEEKQSPFGSLLKALRKEDTSKKETEDEISTDFTSSVSKIKQEPKPNQPAQARFTPNSKADIIIGTVEDKQGNLLPDCIVIIKDKDNEPVRALKSNKLGQFESATPVEQGEYNIEGIKEGYKFTPVPVSALGNPINPVKLLGEKI